MNSQEQHEQADCTPQWAVHYVAKVGRTTREARAPAAERMRTPWLTNVQEAWVILLHRGRVAIGRCLAIRPAHDAVPMMGMEVSHG